MSQTDALVFNGLNGTTGQYGLKLSLSQFSRAIQQGQRPAIPARPTQQTRAVAEHIQATDLAQAGWGILFARNDRRRAEILEALQPLLDLRRAQAQDNFRLLSERKSYAPGESKRQYLTRLGWPTAGPVDPRHGLPYYLLLVGSPTQIPFHFQYQLDVQHAVGRLHFENLADYATYASSVVEAERGDLTRQPELALFGVQNQDDPATRRSSSQLIQPLHHSLRQNLPPKWQISLQRGEETHRADLETLLNGSERRPALLFTASHGMEFAPSDARQAAHQGALVCREWPGPNEWRERIPADFYLAGEHLSARANVGGLISLHFACFGGGTPARDNFSARKFTQAETLAEHAFLASLPQRLLSHPRGSALAVISHVDRAWSYSFEAGDGGDGDDGSQGPPVYQSTLRRLLKGQPVGHALSFLNERYAELASDLTSLLDASHAQASDPLTVASLWTAQNDARNLILLGDPAVCVALPRTEKRRSTRQPYDIKPDPDLSDADWAKTPPAVKQKLTRYIQALSQGHLPEKTSPAKGDSQAETYRHVIALTEAARTADSPEVASELYFQAVEQAKSLKDERLQAVLWLWFGQSCEAEGDVQRAVGAYEVGFEMLAQPGQIDLHSALNSLSRVSKTFVPERPQLLSQPFNPATAADLETAKADPLLAVRLLMAVGNAYFRQPQDQPARNAYQQAMALPLLRDSRAVQAQLLTNLGLLAERAENASPPEARVYFEQALALFEPDDPARRIPQAALAENSLQAGQANQAKAAYETALKLHLAAPAEQADPPAEARVRLGLARLLLADEAIPQAERHLRAALGLLETEPTAAEARTRWLIFTALARCCEHDGRLREAVEFLRRSLALADDHRADLRTDQGLVSFGESVAELSDHLLKLLIDLADAETGAAKNDLVAEALELAEASRARAFGALWRYRRRQQAEDEAEDEAESAPQPEIRPSRLRPFDARSMMLQRASHTPLDPADSDSDSDFDFRQMAQHAISTPLAQPDTSSAEDEAELLPEPPPLARLVFHVLNNETLIFAVAPNGSVRHHRHPLGEAALGEAVRRLRDALAVDQGAFGVRAAAQPLTRTLHLPSDTAPHHLREFYDQLIGPVIDHLPKDDTPVVLEPHGSLWLLPFAALRSPSGQYLIEEMPLLYAPSAQLLNDIRQAPDYGTPHTLSALVVGNPTMPRAAQQAELGWQFDSLPGAEREARAVQAHFPPARSELLLGGAATVAAVETAAERHGILHLATHGIAFAEEPLESFLLLASAEAEAGLWRAKAAQQLDLRADLVTLSACQTGLGQISGDGVLGLSRAFLVAGARAVLVSQWRISDQATAELMAAFYEAYVAVDDKALALQRAMIRLLSQSRFKEPRYWAGFGVIGAEA